MLIKVDIPTDWILIQINNEFSFWIPPSVIEVKGHSIDSYSRHWKGVDIIINFDYGLFSDPLTLYSRNKSYQITNENINNYAARKVSFQKDMGGTLLVSTFQIWGRTNSAK